MFEKGVLYTYAKFTMPEDKLKEELRKAILTDFRISDFS